ncbi:hypothetical protein [Streptomyces formicae]
MSRLRNLTRTAAGSGMAALLVLGSVTPAMAGDGSGKGAWWYRTYDVDRLRAGNATPAEMAKCTPIKPVQWVEEGDPPKEAISPLVLAGLAYARTKLPAPPVTLRPAADNPIVNLATHVKFDAPIDPFWVTAHFDHLGVDIAATTVAKPVALRVDAGTEFADPQSCTYDLTKSKSGDGAHPLQARVTWKVTWTDPAAPEGPARQPALPDGLSTFEQDVAVTEIQSINR